MTAKKIKTIKHSLIFCVFIVVSLIFMFPFFFMFFKSFMTNLESVGNPAIKFLPTNWSLDGYRFVFDAQMTRWLVNTLVIIGFNMVLTPLAAAFVAFGFARCRFKGKDIMFAIVLSTMMIPSTITQIPLYATYSSLGWLNSPFPFIVPSILGGGAINIFLIKQYMSSIPSALDEAARIDGSNKFGIFFRIFLPLSFPIIIFVMIGAFNGIWNDFMGPLLYLKKPASWTLSLGIYYKFAGASYVPGMFPNTQMATGVLMIIPSAIVFFIFQKQIIQGVSTAGIKG